MKTTVVYKEKDLTDVTRIYFEAERYVIESGEGFLDITAIIGQTRKIVFQGAQNHYIRIEIEINS